MLLQIHDELIFEVPPDELDSLKALVKKEMEGVMKLKVPLIVDVSVGKTYGSLELSSPEIQDNSALSTAISDDGRGRSHEPRKKSP